MSLNERVCRKMGIEKTFEWTASRNRRRFYPNLMTPEWAGKLLVMLAAQKMPLTVRHYPEFPNTPWQVGGTQGPLLWRTGATLAEAVCLAIDSMEVQT